MRAQLPGTRVPLLRALAVIAAFSLTLAGCSQSPKPAQASGPATTTVTSAPRGTQVPATPTPAPSTTPAPDSAIEHAKALFDQTNQATISKSATAGGRDFIDALAAAGFRKPDMELTPDRTTINLAAPSLQFSIRLGHTCLIGQYGHNASYQSLIAPALATGTCLIGQTRPINW